MLDELARLPTCRLDGLRTAYAGDAARWSALRWTSGGGHELGRVPGDPLAFLERAAHVAGRGDGRRPRRSRELPLQGRIKASFRRRVQRLPAATQRLFAAGGRRADRRSGALVAIGGGRLGLPIEAMDPAVGDGLLRPRGSGRLLSHRCCARPMFGSARPRIGRGRASGAGRRPRRRARPRWLGLAPRAGRRRPDGGRRRGLERWAGRAQARGGLAAARRSSTRGRPHARARRASAACTRGRGSRAASAAPRRPCRCCRRRRRAAGGARRRHAPAAASPGSRSTCDAPATPTAAARGGQAARGAGSRAARADACAEALRAASVAGRLAAAAAAATAVRDAPPRPGRRAPLT